MNLKNKSVLVYGLGDSGRAVIKILQTEGARVSFYDDDLKFFEYVGFERNPKEKHFDLVVVSPGIKVLGNDLIAYFKEKKIPIISELDFAYLRAKGKIIAVTGTNGKTTVCMLIAKILKEAGLKTFLCGNIGLPFSAICKKTTKDSVTVCEVSNFQLEMCKYFRSDIVCILNVKPDHIDRHGTFEEYKKTKSIICKNLKKNDLLILNLDDEEAKKMIFHKKYQFFSKNLLKKGVFCKNNQIFLNKKPIVSLNAITLKGEKNLENVLAAVSVCEIFKVENFVFEKVLSSFIPASHRMQQVGIIDGVTYVDDSKATNVSSTVACLDAYKNEKIILLVGGQGKDIDYSPIFQTNVAIKKVICFGSEREKIYNCAKKFGFFAEIFENFALAVDFCKKNASSGDFVLLSPACSSFDEFSSYAERGECFKNIVLGCENES